MALLEMNARRGKTALLFLLLAGLFAAPSFSSVKKAPSGIFTQLSSDDLKVGSQLELRLSVRKLKVITPLSVTQVFPSGAKIISVEPQGEMKTTGEGTSITWTGLMPGKDQWQASVKFKLMERGFYRCRTRVNFDHYSEGEIVEIKRRFQRDLSASFSNYSNDQFRDYLPSYYWVYPDTYYVKVTKKSGRAETWDFGSLWKRFKHLFK